MPGWNPHWELWFGLNLFALLLCHPVHLFLYQSLFLRYWIQSLLLALIFYVNASKHDKCFQRSFLTLLAKLAHSPIFIRFVGLVVNHWTHSQAATSYWQNHWIHKELMKVINCSGRVRMVERSEVNLISSVFLYSTGVHQSLYLLARSVW